MELAFKLMLLRSCIQPVKTASLHLHFLSLFTLAQSEGGGNFAFVVFYTHFTQL